MAMTGGPSNTETDGANYTFLLVGKTGSGKSTTGNTILGKKMFAALPSMDSVTSDCKIEETERDGEMIQVVDSPGLFDTSNSHVDVAETIVKTVAGMSPGPDAFLYTVNVAARFTDEDFAAYQRLKAVFDDNVSNHMIVVFTHGDALEEESISINDHIKSIKNPKLLQVLEECKNRYVLFNNKAGDPKPQVRRLLQTVKKMKTENKGHPYSCPKYAAIEEKIQEEVARRLAEVDERELENKKTVQDLKQKTEKAERRAKIMQYVAGAAVLVAGGAVTGAATLGTTAATVEAAAAAAGSQVAPAAVELGPGVILAVAGKIALAFR